MTNQLGENAFEVAYEAMYELVERVYSEVGSISAHMAGLEFYDGKIVGVGRIGITGPEMVNQARSYLLTKYPMVAHISEAWAVETSDESEIRDSNGKLITPSEHHGRFEVVMIMLCTQDLMCMARCPVDPKTKSIIKGELLVPEIIGGRQSPKGYNQRKMNS